MTSRFHSRLKSLWALAGLLVAAAALMSATAASAQAAGPHWTLTMTHAQEPMLRGAEVNNNWTLVMTNDGDEPATGTLTITDHLPPGVILKSVEGVYNGNYSFCSSVEEVNNGAPFTCTDTPEPGIPWNEPVPPGGSYTLQFLITVPDNAPSELTNSATLTETGGGNAPEASVSETVEVTDIPPFHVKKFEAGNTDASSAPYTVAGGHQFQTLNRFTLPLYPNEQMKNAFVKLPLGYFANASATPRCPLTGISFSEFLDHCPAGSKVGVAGVALFGQYNEYDVPIYNVSPDRGYPAQFVFNVVGTQLSLYVVPLPRTEGYGLAIGSVNNGRVDIKSFSATFYGVPSEHGSGTSGEPFATNPVNCSEAEPSWRVFLDTWENPGQAFTSGLPTTTTENGQTVVADPAWRTATEPTPPVTGCGSPALASQFDPTLDVGPTEETPTPQADQPTGLSVDFHFPQSNDPTDVNTVFNPETPQAPELRNARLNFPEGVSISPSSSDGLQGCSDLASDPAGDQVHLGDTKPVDCPLASKIGTATAYTPLLASRDPVDDSVSGAEPIHGDVYLIKPHPGDLSASGDQNGIFRILIQLESARYGINFKLPGIVTANRETGQLTAEFDENPQLPNSRLEIDLKSGPRAPFASPTTCGTFTTTSDLTPWSAPETPDANPSSSFQIESGPNGSSCASSPGGRPFHPSLDAGAGSATAGKASPFVFSLHRQDGEQEMRSIDVTLPKGFSAKLGGIPYCSEAAIASASGRSGAAELANPSCPAASQVGTIDVAAGPGSDPYQVTGKAYLAGPYKGAPLSLVFITPSVAGPFDLGNVVVRAATFLDPESAQVSVKADPLPTILDGVPLRIRSVTAHIDRSDFALNPTSCEMKSVEASVSGASGGSATPSNQFQVAGCDQLGFKPQLSIQLLGGRRATKRRQHPALTAVLHERPGDANLASTIVTLPPTELLDNSHLGTVCSRPQLATDSCPPDSIYGHASATSPLVEQPLSGNVYLVPGNGKLPDLLADLKGQVEVQVRGAISSSKAGGLRAAFTGLPDVPVTQFTLNMEGGKKGLLINSEDLCKAKVRSAVVNMTGQNGMALNVKKLPLQSSCPKKSKKHRKRHHR